MRKFDIQQPVSFPLALVLIMILGYILAWYTIGAGDKIVQNAKVSETFTFKAEKANGLLKK